MIMRRLIDIVSDAAAQLRSASVGCIGYTRRVDYACLNRFAFRVREVQHDINFSMLLGYGLVLLEQYVEFSNGEVRMALDLRRLSDDRTVARIDVRSVATLIAALPGPKYAFIVHAAPSYTLYDGGNKTTLARFLP